MIPRFRPFPVPEREKEKRSKRRARESFSLSLSPVKGPHGAALQGWQSWCEKENEPKIYSNIQHFCKDRGKYISTENHAKVIRFIRGWDLHSSLHRYRTFIGNCGLTLTLPPSVLSTPLHSRLVFLLDAEAALAHSSHCPTPTSVSQEKPPCSLPARPRSPSASPIERPPTASLRSSFRFPLSSTL